MIYYLYWPLYYAWPTQKDFISVLRSQTRGLRSINAMCLYQYFYVIYNSNSKNPQSQIAKPKPPFIHWVSFSLNFNDFKSRLQQALRETEDQIWSHMVSGNKICSWILWIKKTACQMNKCKLKSRLFAVRSTNYSSLAKIMTEYCVLLREEKLFY